jgi:hypothetical protein
MKASHAKYTLKTSVAVGAGVLPKTGGPSRTATSKTAAMVTVQRAWVLKISTGTKWPATAPSPTGKGKYARIDVRRSPAPATTLKASVQP